MSSIDDGAVEEESIICNESDEDSSNAVRKSSMSVRKKD